MIRHLLLPLVSANFLVLGGVLGLTQIWGDQAYAITTSIIASLGSEEDVALHSEHLSADWAAPTDVQVPSEALPMSQGAAGEVVVVPLNVTLTPARDGWQNLSVEFALYNGSSTYLRAPLLPDYEASIAITEGPIYDAEVAGHDWDEATFSLVPMSPGMVACGVVREGSTSLDQPLMLQVTGRIPQDTTPAALMLGPFPPADLTTTAPESFCQFDATTLPSSTVPVVLGADGGVVHAELHLAISENGTVVVAELKNLDRFGDLLLEDLRIWAGYDSGI